MSSEDLIEKARNHIKQAIIGNTELFLAQVIVMNPNLNTLEYAWCSKLCFGEDGSCYQKHWLEKILED